MTLAITKLQESISKFVNTCPVDWTIQNFVGSSQMRGIIEIETQVARLQDADKKFATLRSLDFNWLTKWLCPLSPPISFSISNLCVHYLTSHCSRDGEVLSAKEGPSTAEWSRGSRLHSVTVQRCSFLMMRVRKRKKRGIGRVVKQLIR